MLDYHWPLVQAPSSSIFTFGGPTEDIRQDGIFFDELWSFQEIRDLYMSAYKIYTGSLHTFLEKGMCSFAVAYDLKMTF